MLVFSEKKAEVDDIHEYLLLKGVGAVSIHGGKGEGNSLFLVSAMSRSSKDGGFDAMECFVCIFIGRSLHSLLLLWAWLRSLHFVRTACVFEVHIGSRKSR